MNKLLFDVPANKWNEATPLGNGYLGAMILGRVDKEVIHFNEDTLYSGEFYNRTNDQDNQAYLKVRELLKEGKIEKAEKLAKLYMYSEIPHPRHFEPLGQLWIEFNHKNIKNYRRTLDLENAILTINYESNGNQYYREMFISYPDNVFVLKLKSEKIDFDIDIYLTRRDTNQWRSTSEVNHIKYNNSIGYLEGGVVSNTDKRFAMGIEIDALSGKIKYSKSRISINNTKEIYIYISGRTFYRSSNPLEWCLKNNNICKAKGYYALQECHILDYQDRFNQSDIRIAETDNRLIKLSIPKRLRMLKENKHHIDAGLAQIYINFAKYLLISSSREGTMPANLQGIWNKDFNPPWGSRYTININIEMNYWIAEKLGLNKEHTALLDWQIPLMKKGKEVAKKLYGIDGTVTHHNTDIWGDSAPSDYHMSSTIWPMGSLWLATHILDHYLYTRTNIDKYVSILDENMKFLKGYLFLMEDGYLHTGPSLSPENTYITNDGQMGNLSISPTMDIEIIKCFLKKYIIVSKELNSLEYSTDAENMLDKLMPLRIGKNGQIMEWLYDYEEVNPGHRHISQLYALYPADEIEYTNEKLRKAAERTIQLRIQNGGGETGWSIAWIINFFARLNNGKCAYNSFRKLLTNSTLDNLFSNHPPFQIDGNFGGANGILEMLISDYGHEIVLLPALPKEFPEGSISKYRLKCGAEISFKWSRHKLVYYSIIAHHRLDIKLRIEDIIQSITLEKGDVYDFSDFPHNFYN